MKQIGSYCNMGKEIKIPKGQGNFIEITKKHKSRFINGGKLCYGCNEIRNLDDYYKGNTRCKTCCTKNEKARWKKQNQPLW